MENKFSEVDAKVSQIIDDENSSENKTYSSQKIESLVAQPIVVPIGQPSEIKQGNMWIEIEE